MYLSVFFLIVIVSSLTAEPAFLRKLQDRCNIHNIQVVEDFDIEKASGIWYVVYRSSNLKNGGVFEFSDAGGGDMNVHFLGQSSDWTCSSKFNTVMRHGQKIGDGDFLTRPWGQTNGFVPLKFLYADYDNIMVIYVCVELLENGDCSRDGEHVTIVSRTKSLTPEQTMDAMIYAENACVDTDDLVPVIQLIDCASVLTRSLRH